MKAQQTPFEICGTTLLKYRGNASAVTVPPTVTVIADHAFLGCTSLCEVTIPDTVKEIGIGAFQACRNLETISLPDALKTLGGAAFRGCTALKMLRVPPNIAEISQHLCAGCTALSTVTLPDTMQRINWRAFGDCRSLQDITLPAQLRQIGGDAFRGCTELRGAELPDSLSTLGHGAFYGCSSLSRIRLSEKLDELQAETFSGCALHTLEIPAAVRRVDLAAFSDCRQLDLLIICGEKTLVVNTKGRVSDRLPTEPAICFRAIRPIVPDLRRALYRGYARMYLCGNTTADQDRYYLQQMAKEIRAAALWALDDAPLLQFLMQHRLISAVHAEALLSSRQARTVHSTSVSLLNYIGLLRESSDKFDITKVLTLDDL